MVPLLLDLFTKKAGVNDNEFLSGYISEEKHKLLSYLNDELEGKSFIVGNKLSGADFMLSFNLMMLAQSKQLERYPHIVQYTRQLSALDSYQRAMRLEANHDKTSAA